jgi:hypothetical protein
MTTPNLSFNNSTISFNGTVLGGLLSIQDSSTNEEIDVSASNQDGIYEAGQLKRAITVKCVGGAALTCSTTTTANKGPLAITWHDGSTSPAINNALLTQVSPEGSKNNPISTSYKFVPSTAASN